MYIDSDYSKNVTKHYAMNTMSWDQEGGIKPIPKQAATAAGVVAVQQQRKARVGGLKRRRATDSSSSHHHHPYDADEDSRYSSPDDTDGGSCSSSSRSSTPGNIGAAAAQAVPSMIISSSVSSGPEHQHTQHSHNNLLSPNSTFLLSEDHSEIKPDQPVSSTSLSIPLNWNQPQHEQPRQRFKRQRQEQAYSGVQQLDTQQQLQPEQQHQPDTQRQQQEVQQRQQLLLLQQQHQQPQPALVKSSGLSLTLRPALNEREQFLMFIKILFRILEEEENQTIVDVNHIISNSGERPTAVLDRAKMIVGECTIRNRNNDPAYVNLTESINQRLQPIIPVQLWERSKRMLLSFLRNQHLQRQQQQQQLRATTSAPEKSDSSTSEQRLTTVAV